MQFYLNGYRVGDPQVLPAAAGAMRSAEGLAEEVDVLIVGCGPAGLVLAAQLSAFPDIKTRIVERRAGPLELGQADGIGSMKRSSGGRIRRTQRISSAAGGSRIPRMACPSSRT